MRLKDLTFTLKKLNPFVPFLHLSLFLFLFLFLSMPRKVTTLLSLSIGVRVCESLRETQFMRRLLQTVGNWWVICTVIYVTTSMEKLPSQSNQIPSFSLFFKRYKQNFTTISFTQWTSMLSFATKIHKGQVFILLQFNFTPYTTNPETHHKMVLHSSSSLWAGQSSYEMKKARIFNFYFLVERNEHAKTYGEIYIDIFILRCSAMQYYPAFVADKLEEEGAWWWWWEQ